LIRWSGESDSGIDRSRSSKRFGEERRCCYPTKRCNARRTTCGASSLASNRQGHKAGESCPHSEDRSEPARTPALKKWRCRGRGRIIKRRMKKPEAKRVLTVLAMFTFAVVYASYCATDCALEDWNWTEATQHGESHGASSDHSQDSHDNDSPDSVCAAADHFGAYLPTIAQTAHLEFTNVDRVNTVVPLIHWHGRSPLVPSSFYLSGLAPPPKLKTPVYQQISVLRI
jgi:hypothetical protein